MAEEGFLHAVKQRLPTRWPVVYDAIHAAFDWLPLAALLESRMLVLHGGIGDGSWGLRELQAVPRPLSDAFREVITIHALWSDPSDSDLSMRAGVHASQRGAEIPEFGPDVTRTFCDANDISVVVRSHQYVRQGYKVMHAGRLITLFSARNYFPSEDGHSNDSALLLIAPDGNGHLRVHPKRLVHLPKGAEAGSGASADWQKCFQGALMKCLSP